MSARPTTARGTRTRATILAAATDVFAKHGYHDASVARITERAGVGQGTFYLYFDTKLSVFEEVVRDLNSRVRRAMFTASSEEDDRLAAERAGFAAFFRFTAENPALYRIMRQAEFVASDVLHIHYETIARGYTSGLRAAQASGEVAADLDPEAVAWALMGVGELVGMRWVMRERDADEPGPPRSPEHGLPEKILDSVMAVVERGLRPPEDPASTSTDSQGETP
ncbi:TetR/AcrR family transcriptional regulator [Georgenia sp. Z1491]|uniref:TetR/AcrR family transcriptional regulator n=1 Tax=Georgenia sp. Z1491 TaxID=3416707 RepID=UPI003CE75FCA